MSEEGDKCAGIQQKQCRFSSWLLSEKITGMQYRLQFGLNKVGRHSQSHVKITNSAFVSRHHAEITVAPNDQIIIKDLSMNGIFINTSYYNDCSVELHLGDTIGFGNDPENNEVNLESNIPMFVLTKETIPNNESIIVISDDEDDDREVEDNNICVLPSSIHKEEQQKQHELQEVPPPKFDIHQPIISDVKKEAVEAISNNIIDIFGKPDEDIQNQLKIINPLVYNGINRRPLLMPVNDDQKPLFNGEFLPILDDEYDGTAIITTTTMTTPTALAATTTVTTRLTTPTENAVSTNMKSPNIFDNCLNNCEKLEPFDVIDYVANNNIKNKDSDNGSDNEELMFSQALLDEVKAEFEDSVQDGLEIAEDINGNNMDKDISSTSTEGQHTVIANGIKQETNLDSIESSCFSSSFTQEILAKPTKQLDSQICWTISDDEESDKELVDTINHWSQLLFSQKNKSQVFELNTSSNADDQFDVTASTNEHEIKEELFTSLQKKLDQNDSNLHNPRLSNENNAIKKFPKKKLVQEELPQNSETKHDNIPSTSQESLLNLPNSKKRVAEKENSERKENVPPKAKQQLDNETIDNDGTCKENGEDTTAFTVKSLDEKQSSPTNNDEIKNGKCKRERVPKKNNHPIIINARNLPKHRDKNRGFSAHTLLEKKCTSIVKKIRHEEYTKELYRKWNGKAKTKSKSHQLKSKGKELLGEKRKKRLKEVALKEKKESRKRKIIEHKDELTSDVSQKKKVKVKVTENNRGAFLSENVPPPPPPRRSSISFESKRLHETFSQQITKPDQLLIEQQLHQKKHSHSMASNDKSKGDHKNLDNPPELRVTKVNYTSTKSTKVSQKSIAKPKIIDKSREMSRAYRTTNKVTFASMEKHFEESIQCAKKLNSTSKRIKKVRFNDEPMIFYIDAVPGANKKIYTKDFIPLSTYGDRRSFIRNKYPIIDRTDKIINDILKWSNEWLLNESKDINTSTNIVAEIMPYKFTSFEQYQRIFLNLMQLEYISKLERAYIATNKISKFQVHMQHITPMRERLVLITKLKYKEEYQESYNRYELVLLEIPELKQELFAFISSQRKGASPDSLHTIVFEILRENHHVDQFHINQKVFVRPVMDYIRTEFGCFNAIHQLQSTPLFHTILNPMKLVEYKEPKCRGHDLIYKGCDALNQRQVEILLNTYARIIDETQPNVTLIQGPPGTGKSVVITNLALQILYGEDVRYLDKKILICAQSNAAVDVITSNLYNVILKMRNYNTRFRLIRFGNWDKINAKVKFVALENVVIRDQMKQLVNENKLSYAPLPLQSKEHLHQLIIHLEHEICSANAKINKNAQDEINVRTKQRDLQALRNILNDIRLPESKRKIFSYYLTRANIICTTLPSCVALSQYVDYFDVCIIDEATQCIEPWSLLPLKFGINSLVLVGDTEQLPATVFSQKANDFGLGTSLFTRLQRCLEVNMPKNLSISEYIYCLNVQYRMHPEICLWPNKYFYKNELINAPNTQRTQDGEKLLLQPFTILNLSYPQNDSCENGLIINDLEADFVVQLLKVLHEYIPTHKNSYGVITPYAQHRNVLEKSIRSLRFPYVMVNTIDSYQGTEKDVIIISNARTSGIGFLSNPQRLNVALTRSRKLLILCGNFTHLEMIPVWRSLMENGRSRNLYHEISPDCLKDLKTNVIEKIMCKQSQ